MSAGQDTIVLTLLTPQRRIWERKRFREITLTGAEGAIEILPGHTTFISALNAGPFFVESSEGSESGVISTGFVEVTPKEDGTEVVVMADNLELLAELDANRAQDALRRAEKMLLEANLDEAQFNKYQLKLQRALIRTQAASQKLN